MKKKYYVTDVCFTKGSYGHDLLTWRYGGAEHWAEGVFHIDSLGILHHTFTTPSGKEKEVTIKVR